MKKMNLLGLPVEVNSLIEEYAVIDEETSKFDVEKCRTVRIHYNGVTIIGGAFPSCISYNVAVNDMRRCAKLWARSLPKKVRKGIRRYTLRRLKEKLRNGPF